MFGPGPVEIPIALGFIVICVGPGYLAGRPALSKGQSFSVFFVYGLILTLFGLIPGLILVLLAYSLEPVSPMQE